MELGWVARSAAVPIVLTAVLAAAVHIAGPTPELAGDAREFDRVAVGLISDQDLRSSRNWMATRGYTYPALITIAYRIVGRSPETVAWLQALVLLPLTTLLIYAAGRVAFSARVGLIGAWLFALWLPAAWHARLLMSETLLALLMAALLALLAAAAARDSSRLALTAGVVAGLLSISHPAYQFLCFALIVGSLLLRTRRLLLPLALGTAAIVLPYNGFTTLADTPRLGEAAEVYGGGWTFYAGSRWETGFTNTPDDRVVASNLQNLDYLERLIVANELHLEPDLIEVIREKNAAGSRLTDADFYRLGLSNLLERPDKWPLKLRRGLSTLFAYSAPIWIRPLWQLLGVVAGCLALTGLILVSRRQRPFLLIFVPAVFQLLPSLIAHAESRYVIPLWPSIFVLVGFALVKPRPSLRE